MPSSRFLRCALTLAVLVGAVWPASAQYFGRNKVQYENFAFRVLATDHYAIYSYLQDETVLRDHARMAERWYNRLHSIFEVDLAKSQPLILYADQADFQQTNVVGSLLGQGVGGVTEGLKNRIVLPLTGIYADNDHVIGHELTHAFQFTAMRRAAGGTMGLNRAPLWMTEGLAEYVSLGRSHPLTAMWLRDAVLRDDVPDLDDLGDPKRFPYRWGHAAWAWLATLTGDDGVFRFYREALQSGFGGACKRVIGQDKKALNEQWRLAVEQTCRPTLAGRTPPGEVGDAVPVPGLGYNFAPTLSPTGRLLALLSQQDVVSLDLFLVDTLTGEVRQRLASSRSDAHFDALRFIDAAGAWSPDGKRLAFVVYAEGDNRLAIVDVLTGEFERTKQLDGVEGITHLAWSPDGTQIAVAGISAGVGDLVLYDLASGRTQRLTEDRYAELSPAWSPDGRTLAFATDRGGGADLERLTYGNLKIGLMDVASGEIRLLELAPGVKHLDPRYSPDGRDLFFVAAPDGISDIFRYDLDEDRFYRVTRVATGVTGLTENSPTLSVASQSGRLAFTVFDDGKYRVRTLAAEQARGEPFAAPADTAISAAALPPPQRLPGAVDSYLDRADAGLPASDKTYEQERYRPRLGLVTAGQSAVGVSIDRFGTGVGGWVSFLFSDVLGNRLLTATVQGQGEIQDVGGELVYQNLSHRWNWGGAVGHIPYRTAYFSVAPSTETIDGTVYNTITESLVIQQVTLDRAVVLSEYPLSVNRRLEFATGFSRYSFRNELREAEIFGDRLISYTERDLDAPASVNLVESGLAYVGDYSYFGFTGPIAGKRFRIEAAPTFGGLSFVSFLTDYRHYFHLSPLTLAVRGLHYGRYFGDAESPRLAPQYIGYDTLVRGYDLDTIDLAECTDRDDQGNCNEVGRLIGSRLGVVNFEARLPVFGTEDYGLVDFPYLPTELALFLDGGVAWTRDEPPVLKITSRSTERIPVFSAGLAVRFNLFGAIVAQTYVAWPFQRPQRDHTWGFVLAPGW